jgi:hypothetical protein
MKDRTIMFSVMAVLAIVIIGMFGYFIFIKQPELSAPTTAQCGTGTALDQSTGKCVATGQTNPNTPANPATTQCQIPDTQLNLNFLQIRQAGDPATYINSSYEVFQFGSSQGVVTQSVGTSGGKGSGYDASLTKLTPGYPITIWVGSTGSGTSDVWYQTESVDVACQAAVSHTSKVHTLGTATFQYFNTNGEFVQTPATPATEIVAEGQTISPSFKVKESTANGALGNPVLTNPIGYCFGYNVSEVKSARIVDGTQFPVPQALSGITFECYQWNHPALFNYQTSSADLTVQFKTAAQGAGIGDIATRNATVDMYLVTQNYYKNGNGDYVTGWENDNSVLLGLGSLSPALQIGYNSA